MRESVWNCTICAQKRRILHNEKCCALLSVANSFTDLWFFAKYILKSLRNPQFFLLWNFLKSICELVAERNWEFLRTIMEKYWIFCQRFQKQIGIMFIRSLNKIAKFVKNWERNCEFRQEIVQKIMNFNKLYRGKYCKNHRNKLWILVICYEKTENFAHWSHKAAANFVEQLCKTVANFANWL